MQMEANNTVRRFDVLYTSDIVCTSQESDSNEDLEHSENEDSFGDDAVSNPDDDIDEEDLQHEADTSPFHALDDADSWSSSQESVECKAIYNFDDPNDQLEAISQHEDNNERPLLKHGPNIRRFKVHYDRHTVFETTYDVYGSLEFDMDSNKLILRNDEGRYVSSSPYLEESSFAKGSQIILSPKIVTIINEKEIRLKPGKWPQTDSKPEEPPLKMVFRTESKTVYSPWKLEPKIITTHIVDWIKPPVSVKQPLSREEIVILCRPTNEQKQNFQEIYDKISFAPDSEVKALFEDLQRYCNGPLCVPENKYPGKLNVLLGIVKGSLELNESLIIIVKEDHYFLNDLQKIFWKEFKEPCFLFENECDEEALDNNMSKICIIKSKILNDSSESEFSILKRHQFIFRRFHRAIAYEDIVDLDYIKPVLNGPFYLLITSGTVEERDFQHINRQFDNISIRNRLYDAPGNYHDSDTHMMLNCRCITGEEDSEDSDGGYDPPEPGTKIVYETRDELKFEWDHIPGDKVEPAEHLQVS